MDLRWYLKGLLAQPYVVSYEPYPIPPITGEGLLRRVQGAVQNFAHAVNSAFYLDQLAAGDAWSERRKQIIGWLALLDASAIDLDYEAEELAKVPEVKGDGQERSTTIFGSLDEILQAEGRERQDRINLQRAVAFYLMAVDQAVRTFSTFVDAREDVAAQTQFAEDTIRQIEHYAARVRDIQQYSPAGSGQRPLV
ncbi:hypothetical protein QRB38_13700 [Mycobacterium avium subsp. hominissuis]|uniref:hypothetical protein n=1 Tax=Mycobacterium avium TaxID=1764 RepID=UPI0026652DEA|nr:hypothetical protein [Mycobacterium avium]MDO2394866.1 hypothetical protein [Mycobacterium avium subsp. hominissuis]